MSELWLCHLCDKAAGDCRCEAPIHRFTRRAADAISDTLARAETAEQQLAEARERAEKAEEQARADRVWAANDRARTVAAEAKLAELTARMEAAAFQANGLVNAATNALVVMARASERIHSMPRTSDTELAARVVEAKEDLRNAVRSYANAALALPPVDGGKPTELGGGDGRCEGCGVHLWHRHEPNCPVMLARKAAASQPPSIQQEEGN